MRLVGLVLAILLLVAVAPAAAVKIPLTSAAGFPNGRTSNDLPSNAIDGNPGTFTWTTETNNTAALRTPLGKIEVTGGTAVVGHQKAASVTTVGNVRGRVSVTPDAGAPFSLVPGRQARITRTGVGRPFPLVPDLGTEIPNPRVVRAGPATATAPSTVSLRSLKRSKCVRVAVASAKPARVLVTIFSGRLSVRLFGQRQVRFAKPGRTSVCIRVPARAKTFNVRTPLSFAVGYALGARPRPGQRPTRPVVKPIKLVP